MYAIGIDVGGTSIKWGLVSEDGKVLATDFIQSRKDEDQNLVADKLVYKIDEFLKQQGVERKEIIGIGIGSPGTIDSKEGEVIYTNNLDWKHFPLAKILENRLGLTTKITNDANAATLGEVKFGAGKKYKNVIMLTLGTGVGGGIVIDGKLIEGNKGGGAELGHAVINFESDILCTCGRYGCLEVYASATALIRQTKQAMEANRDSKLWDVVDHDITKVNGKTVWDGYDLNDKTAIEVVNNYIHYLGIGILNYCNIFRPEALILSGGIAKQGDRLVKLLTDYCEKNHYGYGGSAPVKILIAELGYESGIIGAASLVL